MEPTPSAFLATGSLTGSNREFEWAGADNYHVRYLIAPTVRRMKEINVATLRIELRGTKILFLMEPAADGPCDERQPEENVEMSHARRATGDVER